MALQHNLDLTEIDRQNRGFATFHVPECANMMVYDDDKEEKFPGVSQLRTEKRISGINVALLLIDYRL